MRIIKITILILLIFSVLIVATPFVGIRSVTNRHIEYSEKAGYPLQGIFRASDYGLKAKQMYLKTNDGFNVWASEVYTQNPKAVVIYLTGIEQPSVTYFYGHAKFMQENGYSSILLEVRGHGKSKGDRICLGYKESGDVKAVVDYIKSEKKYRGVPIVIQGVSMGGAVATNAFGQINDIDALIAMSTYSSFEDILSDRMNFYGVPKLIQIMEKPLFSYTLKKEFGSEVVSNIKPIQQIKNANGRPVMLIACSKDTSVPAINTERLKRAYPKAKVWIRDSNEHFIIKENDFKNVNRDTEYCRKILDFLNDSVVSR